MEQYVKSTITTLRILRALPNYASKRAETDIGKLDVDTSSAIHPLKTMKACVVVLESCVSALEMDKEAQKEVMERMKGKKKWYDWINDMLVGAEAAIRVYIGEDKDKVIQDMANQTRTGKGKVTVVRYVAAWKEGKLVPWAGIENTKKVLDEMLDDNVKFNNMVERSDHYIKEIKELIRLIQKEIE